MEIRPAQKEDIPALQSLLRQVLMVHHEGRPDLFKADCEKYSRRELLEILKDRSRPVFVAVKDGRVAGYVFCILERLRHSRIMTDIRTLHIDDFCVEEHLRGQGIGTALFQYVRDYAISRNCRNLTLNVWALNERARKFYAKCGLVPQKIGLETVFFGEDGNNFNSSVAETEKL